MFSRCQFASRISKTASTYKVPVKNISRATKRRSCSASPSSARYLSSGVGAPSETVSPRTVEIEWPTESWDDIFNELDKAPLKPRSTSFSPRKFETSSSTRPVPRQPLAPFFSPQPSQRQTLSKREQDTLSEMVDWILKPESSNTNNTQAQELEKVVAEGKVDDLVSRLRRFSRKAKLSINPSTELLDQKKEEMSWCANDQELLDWAAREVFGQSTKLEDEVNSAMVGASQSGHAADIPLLQSPIYPELIAHLMQTFRVQFRDPNLALFIFDHAKRLSTLSFVFGCSTGAYNELIETQWLVSRDLDMIHDSLEEMIVNGVTPNSRTRKLIDTFRRQVAEQSNEGESIVHKRMETLLKMEQLLSPTKRPKGKAFDEWKTGLGQMEDENDFNDWRPKKKTQSADGGFVPRQELYRNRHRAGRIAYN
ncbi:hypothetical protein CVT25_011048 [Psilocybe cyanescens]|uniref:Mtf2-like C-terminal domain-containing protein n=1 Tax=Psilocybe cyanescens TaxID=93625 RepID=A0A409WFB2_PSICY|nr:hypothetical protein CVT25_011048 [Psilocybe cyanescens]